MQISELPPAGLHRRLGALIYDALLLMALAMAYGAVFLWLKYSLMGITLANGEKASMGGFGFIGLILLVYGYYWFFWCRVGQTTGMKAWRIVLCDDQTITTNGPIHQGITLAQALIRSLVAPISLVSFLLGYFWCLWDKDKKTWHDRVSSSQVLLLPKK